MGIEKLRTLSLALFLMLSLPVCLAAHTPQPDRVQQAGNNEPMATALKKIEKLTGYRVMFAYDDVKNFKAQQKVTAKDIRKALAQAIGNQPLAYTIDGKFVSVTLKKNGAPATTLSQNDGKVELRGKVTDEYGDPLPGVSVQVENSKQGAVTTADGSFRLSLAKGHTVNVLFSFIGMKNETYVFNCKNDMTNLVIRMKDDASQVSEVVVTGIYTRNRESFTGSSATYGSKELKNIGNGNVLQSLKTLDPSFAIMENNTMGSDPNQSLNIEIRGKTSVIGLTDEYSTDPNQPLFILDGFESTLAAISDLSMDRVASITVLKDASATAIYGSKAANGVVVVETKMPSDGKLQVTYNGNMNFTFADLSDYNLMNAEEKLEFERLSGVYGSLSADGNISDINEERLYNSRLAEVRRGVDTYWMNEPLRFAVSHRHNMFLEGGTGALRYGVGVNYGKTEGVMKGSDRDVINGNVRLIYRVGRLSFTNSLNIDYNKAAHEIVPFSKFAQANPFFRKENENGEPIRVLESFRYLDINTFSIKEVNIYSPFYDLSNTNYNNSSYFGFTENFEMDWRIVDELRFRTKIGLGKSNEQNRKFLSPFNVDYIGSKASEKGRYTESNKNQFNYDADVSLTYGSLLADKHMVNAVGGARITQQTYNLSGFTMRGFTDDEFSNPTFAQEYDETQKVYRDTKNRTFSGYMNVGYSYENRYLVDGSFRVDGSSVFGSNKRFTTTWAVGLGWNVHKEPFMKDVTWIDQLKLRGSIGNPGNQNFDAYIAMKIYQYNNHHTTPWGASAIIQTFGNDNLEWQKTLDKNIGLDLMLFNRLRFNFDYFWKDTDPLLVYIGLPASTGSTSQPTNIGGQITKGYTIVANYSIIKRPQMLWSVNVNLRHLKSKYNNVERYLSKYNADNKSKNLVRYYDGGSPTDLWAVRSAGIDPATGREIFIRKDGTQTFTHSYDDEVVVGNSNPDYEGVIGTSFYYKGFSCSANLRYRLGGQTFLSALYNKVENISIDNVRYNQDKRALYDRWKNPGDQAKFKAISTTATTPMSSRFIADNNVLSGESISLGYETPSPSAWMRSIGLSSITVRAYMNDIFRISTVKEERGIDYPFARTVAMSLGLRF